ncbi:MAG TPA: hypothetical protein VI197_08980 [Polyangiaceae bacterium]
MPPAIAHASVYLAFEPSQRFVRKIVQWITDFCELSLQDVDVVARVHMAIYELAENLVKYGASDSVRLDVEVERVGAGSVLRLRTRNAAAPERLAEAVRILQGLRDAEDPVAYYDQLVLESAPKEGVSGLGLARIRAEGDLDLDFEVDGNQLCIVVEAKLPDEVP